MSKLSIPTNLYSIPSRKFKLDRKSEYYAEDRALMKQYQMLTFKELYESHERIVIFDCSGVTGKILSDLRHLLREEYESELFMGKNAVLIKMIKELISSLSASCEIQNVQEIQNLKQLMEILSGQVILLFTNRDPLDMKKLVESKISFKQGKLGEPITKDFYLLKGDTNTEAYYINYFRDCSVSVRIRLAQVEIRENCLLLEQGTKVNSHQLRLLKHLKIRPFPVGCQALYVLEKTGGVYSSEILSHDLNPSVYEAMNNLGALSLECNLINQLTMIAELKTSIYDIKALMYYVEEDGGNDMFELDQ